VLEHVGQHDHLVAPLGLRGGEALERLLHHVQAEHLARVLGGPGRELDPAHVVPAPARLVEQQAVAAAHVEERARRHVPADQIQEPARGGAPAGLLAEVRLVLHLAVELV
jgi:hypothetical protein